MKVTVKRFADNGNASLGLLYIDGIFQCFTVEDEERATKVYGETRVPNGVYKLSLRKSGRYHNKYKVRYEGIHKGMLCVHNKPNWVLDNLGIKFQYILIHTGNTDKHTAGCLLLNDAVSGQTFSGNHSVDAYKRVYPIIADHLAAGGECTIEYTDIEEGK